MKKLYVLVFLTMFMGKIFGSDQIVFNNLRNPNDIVNANNFKYIDVASFDKSSIVNLEFKLPSNNFLFKLIIPKSNLTNSGENIKGGQQYTIKKGMIDRIELLLSKYQTDLILTRSFFTENSIEMPTLTLSDLKGNPWDTIAPRVFAGKFSSIGITEPALKSIGISNWIREAILRGKPLTLEQRFTIRLQKALIEKISGIKNVASVMEPLRALLLANSKIPDGLGKKTITEIFNFISPDIKAAVIKEIMKSLDTVKLDKDGNITNKQNTLAELVLEKITDSNYREALVEMAQSLKVQDDYGLSRVVALNEKTILERLIDNPQKAFDLNEETQYLRKLLLTKNTEESAESVFVKVKLAELAPKTIAKVEKTAEAEAEALKAKTITVEEAKAKIITAAAAVRAAEETAKISLQKVEAAQELAKANASNQEAKLNLEALLKSHKQEIENLERASNEHDAALQRLREAQQQREAEIK